MILLIFIAIFSLKSFVIKSNEFKLSESKILLPRTTFLSINYTLRGSPNICHEWFSGTPEVIVITPIIDESSSTRCSHESIITSVWQSNNRATATVYAKNIASGHIVKCDVIIDNIHKLEIETRTLELYLHETPEALTAKALDEYGNTFSTLDGVPFEWSIHAHELSNDGQNVLRFITWTESEYITPVLIGSLEKQGLQGYMQLVSGLKTGAAKISFVFRDDKLKTTVRSSEVRLLVMANAALSPPLAYVIPQTQLSYKVLVHSQGSTREVKMPNDQYYLKINNTDLAELDEKGSTLTAKKFGQTEVTLIDKNIKEDFRHPSSILYIVEQGFLTFHISPGDNQWVLQSGNDNVYIITVRPFDFNSHAIFISDNMRLDTHIPKEYFEILFSSKNGTYNVVRAIKEGNTILKSNFSFILLKNGTSLKLHSPIVGSQDLTIFPPICVVPQSIIIPWYPNGVSVPGYLFKATGGSGEYKWMVSDSISWFNSDRKNNYSVSVDSLGYIKPLKLGISYIVAADQRNFINRGMSTVNVDTIHSISFLLEQVEVEVNNELSLPLKVVNHKNETMSHCHWLPYEFLIGDVSKIKIVEVVSSYDLKDSEACALIRAQGIATGFSKITVSLLKLLTSKTSNDFLTTSVTVGAFRPTRFIDPYNGVSIIGVLSMQMLHIIDGPLPWTLDPLKYFYEFKELDEKKHVLKKISLKKTETSNLFSGLLLQIQCIEMADVEIAVSIGNRPSIKNPYPVTSVGTMRLSCTLPVYMKLIPKWIPTNISIDCPLENNTDIGSRITVNNKRPLVIEVLFSDRNGFKLDRSESFNIDVEIKSLILNQNIQSIVSEVRPKIIYENNNKGNDVLDANSYFYVSPNDLELNIGDIQVKAISNSYRIGKGPKFHLESSLNLRISKSMVVEPTKLVLYQHEKVSGKFSVKHGSGHFIALPLNPDFLKVNLLHKYMDDSKGDIYEIFQMKVDKSQRNGVIQVMDTCFNSVGSESENIKTITVELVRPFKLQVVSLNKIQLGSQINVLLQIFDDTDNIFPSEYLHMLEFELVINDNLNIISAHSLYSKEWIISPCEYSRSSGFIFKVTGETLGFTSFLVVLKQNNEIISNIQKIEVFPPLRLSPKHIVLLEGTEVQLSSIGGPRCCHDMLHFSIIKNSSSNTKESKIEFVKGPNGLIKGVLHGMYAVTVRIEILDSDPINENRPTILSKDQGLAGVVQIKSILIHAPTNRLITGNSMPLWISFTSSFNDLEHLHITGFSLAGQQKTQISFKWNLNPPQGVVVNLKNFLEPAGIQIDNKHLHSGMRIMSLNPGKQKVEVSVSGLPHNWLSKNLNKNEPLVAKLNIAIISKLDILDPFISVKTLLLPPSTRITLKSTLDSEAIVTYSLLHYDYGKMGTSSKSQILSGNILETNHHIASNEEEQFVLHIRSSQPIKLNAANEAIGNQSLAIFVKVKHPTYSMLSPFISEDSLFQRFITWKKSIYNTDIISLPLGGPFLFLITNHDELGNMFDISPDANTISYNLHRSDNLAISIATDDQINAPFSQEISNINTKKLLQLQGLSSGDNILQLFYRDSFSEVIQLTDILSIPTGPVLQTIKYHKNTCIEGLKIQYIAPFDHGFWYSSDPDAVAIDSDSGEAILRRHGTSTIFYGLNQMRNVKGQQIKNVLISNELTVLTASRLTIKLVEKVLLFSNDPCSNGRCIPINFDYKSNVILGAIYIYSPSIMYEELADNFVTNTARNISEKTFEMPIECNVDFNFGENSVFRQDLFSSLINVEVQSIPVEYDSRLGIRQWACYVTPRHLDSFTKEDLVSVLSLKYDLRLQLRARLRYNDMKSDFVSVPVVLGYILSISNDNQKLLTVRASGEVLTDIKIILSPSTKRLLDENKNVVLSVISNKPNILEVLAPRQSGMDAGLWVYPLKAVVVNKEIVDEVEITISFPLTKQVDKIIVKINIIGKLSDETRSKEPDAVLSRVNWIRPVLCVMFTGFIAIMIVILVNNIIRPTIDDEVTSSPIKQMNMSLGSTLPFTPLGSPRTHIWNNPGTKKDISPNIDYGRYSFNMSHN